MIVSLQAGTILLVAHSVSFLVEISMKNYGM